MSPPPSEAPLVSVLMVTYNHERYVARAIEGALMQQVDFPWEIVIGEDCSTDRTREIVCGYRARYGDRITLLLQEKNAGMQKNFADTYRACRGRYVALLDGDDYWTDPQKLRKQVEFLEKNTDFAICFHNMQVLYEDDPTRNRLSNPDQPAVTTLANLAEGNYIYTASCLFRKNFPEIPEWFGRCLVADYPLHLLNARYGKIGFLDEVMGVYRVHKGGVWENRDARFRMEKWIETLETVRGEFAGEVRGLLGRQLSLLHYRLAESLNGGLNRKSVFRHSFQALAASPFNGQVSKKSLLKMVLHQAFPGLYRRVRDMAAPK